MTNLRDLVNVHISNASHATARFNYHRHQRGFRIVHCKNAAGRICQVPYEYAGDIDYDKAHRRSTGRSRRILDRLLNLCRDQLNLTADWVKRDDGSMINTWSEHGMRHRSRKVGGL